MGRAQAGLGQSEAGPNGEGIRSDPEIVPKQDISVNMF